MAIGNPTTKTPPALADMLVERKPLPVAQSIKIAAAILNAVRRLHTAGSIHGRIDFESVRFDPAQGRLALMPPAPTCELGGLGGDPSLSPPELQGAEPIVLPTRIDEAERVLAAAGLAIVPRGIDLHQVAALLAHLLTGMPVSKYLRSVKVKALVPATLQSVLERGLAFRPGEQFRSCDEFLDALNAAAKEQGVALRLAPTPSTPAVGQSAPTPRPVVPAAVSPSAPAPAKVPPADELPAESDLPFTRLAHYRLVRRLGRGGMGDVFLGHEAALERMVAIKVLPPELGKIEDFVRRFQLEASAVARLNHPNIVPVHFIGHDADRHFFAMQFVEGQSLEQLLREKGKLPVAEAVNILRQCLAGLGEAHRTGLVHRDVKPANILLEAKTGRALVADFGLVKSMGRSGATLTGVVLGTVDYIAPEQARGKDVDGRADLYALGVMSYQMLSGRLPFDADSASAMIFQHAYEPPPPLRQVAPELPEALTQIVERLLLKDPELRYRSCEEVLADLQLLAGDARPSDTAPWRPSRVVRASEIGALPVVPPFVPPPRPERWFEALGRKLRAKAPQALRQLQSTSLQMDDALADYEERRGQVLRLVEEGREAIGQLTAQAQAHRAGAIAADNRARSAESDERREALRQERLDHERTAGELDAQAVEQRAELEQLELILARASADLGKLRAQRDQLHVRLRIAEAELKPAADPRRRRKRLLLAGIGVAAALMVGIIGIKMLRTTAFVAPLSVSPAEPAISDMPIPTPRIAAPLVQSLPPLVGVEGAVHDLMTSKDGKLLYACTGWPVDDKKIRVWNIATGELLQTLTDHPTGLHALALSPDGTRFLSGGDDGQIVLWDIATNTPLKRFQANKLSISQLDWAQDGKRFVSAGGADKHVRLWDIDSEKPLWDGTGHVDMTKGAAFLPGDKQIITADQSGKILLWDAATGTSSDFPELERQIHWLHWMMPLPDGKRILVAGNQAGIWDLRTSRKLVTFSGHRNGVLKADISPDGKYVVTGSYDGRARLFDARTGRLIEAMPAQGGSLWGVRFAPDSRTFFSAGGGQQLGNGTHGIPEGADRSVHVWRYDPEAP